MIDFFIKTLRYLLLFCLLIQMYVVNAQVDTSTSYYITIEDINLESKYVPDISTEVTYLDIINNFSSLTSEYNNVYIFYQIRSGTSRTIDTISIFIEPKGSTHDMYFYGSNNGYFNTYATFSNGYLYSLSRSQTQLYFDTYLTNAKKCYTDNVCEQFNSRVLPTSLTASSSGSITNFNVNTDNNIIIPFQNSATSYFYMYSSTNILYNVGSNTANYYKNVYIQDTLINIGDKVPSYYDLFIYKEPEPDPEPEPEPDPEPTNRLVNWIYYFVEPNDIESLLFNIYTILFIYCFSIIILKFIQLIKVKNRR